jgi:ABC-2 type transport system permease protein
MHMMPASAAPDRLRQLHVNVPTVTAQSRAWYNPDLKSRNYMVPGVMGILLLVTTTLVTSMALVKEREEGTMEQLMVTPLRGGEIIVGKLLPFVVVGFVELTLTLPVMLLVFHVPFNGSFLVLYLVSGLFLLTTLGLGLFVSTLVKTQQQAMLFATFFVAMPFVLLSGFIFPVENMPPLLGAVAALIPMKYYLTCVRGVFLKGVGMDVLWREALVLLVWGVGILALATAKFHKRLD